MDLTFQVPLADCPLPAVLMCAPPLQCSSQVQGPVLLTFYSSEPLSSSSTFHHLRTPPPPALSFPFPSPRTSTRIGFRLSSFNVNSQSRTPPSLISTLPRSNFSISHYKPLWTRFQFHPIRSTAKQNCPLGRPRLRTATKHTATPFIASDASQRQSGHTKKINKRSSIT